jgi:Tfp pilus assembly protein PilN
MVDLHKEIKLSDLFKRKPKGSEAQGEEPAQAKPPKEKKRKEPKPHKERRRKDATVVAHEAPPLPEIPLMRAFNLLPQEEVRQAKEGPSPVPYVLVALVGVLLFAALAAFYLMAGTDVERKKGQIEDLRAELAGYQASARDVALDSKSAGLAGESAGRSTALSAALANRLAWDRVLREIALIVPDDVSLTVIQGTSPVPGAPLPADGSERTDLTLTGTVESHANVAEFMARLSVIPEITSVRLKEAGTSSNEPGRVGFTITATVRRGP